jgi:regulator of protease activity HflC (stomatin/prohibitin superfamily)
MSEHVKTVNKQSKKLIVYAAVAVILFIVASNAFFILEEDESALVQRFGRIEAVYMRDATDLVKTQINNDPDATLYLGTGLKLKIPFIDNVIKYPAKITSHGADK